jgi:primary-amine oxidase
MPWSDLNLYGQGFEVKKNPIARSGYSDFALNRVFKITNPNKINRITGHPVAYQVVSPPKQMLLAYPDSHHSQRAKYAEHAFWVTKHSDDELFAAGNYTNQSIGDPRGRPTYDGSGDLATWAARKDSVDNTDIVIWHSVSLTHSVRIEDYPVMPCDTMTVMLKPSGFFEENPALDVPQSSQVLNKSQLYVNKANGTAEVDAKQTQSNGTGGSVSCCSISMQDFS